MALANIVTGSELEADQQVEPPVPEGFRVHDAATANWLVRKIVEARAYGKHVREWAARELRRAEREEQFFFYRFGCQLEDWVRQQLDAQNQGKTIFLPAGSVGYRKTTTRLEIRDEKQLIAWCKSNLPAAIHVVETVLRTVITDHFSATGELPNGAELIDGNERFFVK